VRSVGASRYVSLEGTLGPERDRRLGLRRECDVKNDERGGGGRGGARCDIGADERKVG
jgi:hypothetical protein